MGDSEILPPKTKTDDARIVVQRPVYDEQRFNERFAYSGDIGQPAFRTAWLRMRNASASFFRCQPLSAACISTRIERIFPVIAALRTYNIRLMLLSDIVAGFTAAIMNVPQGMAYGMLAAVGPVEGLYTSFFPPLVYGFFASSRHVSYGTFAVTSMMMASVVGNNLEAVKTILRADGQSASNALHASSNFSTDIPSSALSPATVVDNDDPVFEHQAVVHIATSSSLACGLLMLIAAVFRLSCVSSYLSDDLIGGFSAGAAVHIVTSQLKTVFGVQAGNYAGWLALFKVYRDIIQQASHINYHTVALSVVCITILLVTKIYVNGNRRVMRALNNVPVPTELILVALATLLSFLFYFDRPPHKMQIVGKVPVGLPSPSWPRLDVMQLVFNECISITIVAFCMTVSLGRIFGTKYGYRVSASAELRALGLSNFATSFFSCMPSSGGLTRSLVVANVGGFTQLATFINCLLLLLVLLFVGPLLSPLPTAVLASIIIAALRPMFVQMGDLRRLMRVSVVDASIWLVTFMVCILFDVSTGLFAGIVYALFTVVLRFQRPSISPLGRIRGTELYKPMNDYNECDETPSVRVVRIESPIYFANVEYCRVKLMSLSKLHLLDNGDDSQRKVSLNSVTSSTAASGEFTIDDSLPNFAGSSTSSSLNQNELNSSLRATFDEVASSGQKQAVSEDKADGLLTPALSPAKPGEDSVVLLSSTSAHTNGVNSHRDIIILPNVPLAGEKQQLSTTNTGLDCRVEVDNDRTQRPSRFLVIDCTMMTFIDTSGVALLLGFIGSCRRAEVGVLFASCSNAVRDMLHSSLAKQQRDLFFDSSSWRFVSVHDAVVYAASELRRYGQMGRNFSDSRT